MDIRTREAHDAMLAAGLPVAGIAIVGHVFESADPDTFMQCAADGDGALVRITWKKSPLQPRPKFLKPRLKIERRGGETVVTPQAIGAAAKILGQHCEPKCEPQIV